MQSPFQIFRKHQKTLIVVLGGLAILGWTIQDALVNAALSPTTMVMLLAVVIGGAAWVVGLQGGKGKQSEYGVSGAVIGLLIGLVFMIYSRYSVKAAVETTAGNISKKELQEMVDRRRKAVTFMYKAYEASVEKPPGNIPFQFLRFSKPHRDYYENGLTAAFGIERNRAISERDVVFKYLLLQEAEELGIKVDDVAVQAYIRKATKNKLTSKAYANILKSLQVGHPEMYDILREEITAQIVKNLRLPDYTRIPTPAEYWDLYRKLHISQNLEYVSVPVEPFTTQIADPPDDKELVKLFDKYKDRSPLGISPDPAFGIPERIQLAYFMANYQTVQSDVEARLKSDNLTDKEIADALDDIQKGIKDVEQRITDGKIQATLVEKERTNARQDELQRLLKTRPVNRFEFEIVKQYEDQKATAYTNPEWQQDPFPETDDPFLQADPVRAPKPDGMGGLIPEPKKPAPEPPKKKSDESGAFLAPSGRYSPVVAFAQPKKPETGKKKPDDKTAPKFPKVLKPTEPPPPDLPEDPPPEPFREFSEVRAEIRDQLLRRRVVAEIRKRIQQAATEMEKYASQYLTARDKPGTKFPAKEVSRKLADFGKKIGLEYHATAADVSFDVFQNESKFPMANAERIYDFSPRFGQPPGAPVYSFLFTPRNRESKRNQGVYRVILAEVPRPGTRTFEPSEKVYVLWKTQLEPARVPAFKDVRKEVLKAWKMIEARKKAEDRAKDIAELIKKSEKPMSRIVDGLTVTGESDDRKLPNPGKTFMPITWMTEQRSSVPQLAMMGHTQLVPTPIIGIPNVGPEFRRVVFDDLQDGEVGVAPNFDKSTYYVVRVLDRIPTTPNGLREFMKRLLADQPTSQLSSTYRALNSKDESPANRQLKDKLRERLMRKYSVTWNIEADNP